MTPFMQPVERSARFYHMLLHAYPAPFRRQYGEEMTLVFREQASDAWDRAGWMGLAGVWLHVLVDLAQTIPAQHLLACKGILPMDAVDSKRTKTLVCLSLFAAYALNLVLVGVLGLMMGLTLWLFLGNPPDHPGPASELLLCLLPPFLTGVIASRTKMFYRPHLIAPLAPMMIWAATGIFDTGVPWLLKIGFSLLVGSVTFLGCYASDRVSLHKAPSCPTGS